MSADGPDRATSTSAIIRCYHMTEQHITSHVDSLNDHSCPDAALRQAFAGAEGRRPPALSVPVSGAAAMRANPAQNDHNAAPYAHASGSSSASMMKPPSCTHRPESAPPSWSLPEGEDARPAPASSGGTTGPLPPLPLSVLAAACGAATGLPPASALGALAMVSSPPASSAERWSLSRPPACASSALTPGLVKRREPRDGRPVGDDDAGVAAEAADAEDADAAAAGATPA